MKAFNIVAVLSLAALLADARCPGPEDELRRYESARASVSSLLANVSDAQLLALPCRSAGAHGPQARVERARAGCGPAAYFGDASTRSRTRFYRYPLFSPCQLFVSHKYRLVFVRQPKSASTAVLDGLKDALCESRTCRPDEFAEVPVLRPHIFDEYTVVTFVRNPWTRAVSAYRMMHKWFLRKRLPDGGAGDRCGVPFRAFARDAHAMIAACWTRDCCPYIEASEGRAGGSWAPWFVDQHVNDQAGCASSADFVGRMERSQDDWDAMIAFLNLRPDVPKIRTDVALRNPNGQAPGGRVETRCEIFRRPDVVRDLALQYAADVLEFGYLPDFVDMAV